MSEHRSNRPRNFLEILDLKFEDLAEYCEGLLRPFEAEPDESPIQLDARLNKSIDELPDVYTWFMSLFHRQVNATESVSLVHGVRSAQFKKERVKKDFLEDMARAAKLRYDGASRRITRIQMDRERMPHTK